MEKYLVFDPNTELYLNVADDGTYSWDAENVSFLSLSAKTNLDDARKLLKDMLSTDPVNVDDLVFIKR